MIILLLVEIEITHIFAMAQSVSLTLEVLVTLLGLGHVAKVHHLVGLLAVALPIEGLVRVGKVWHLVVELRRLGLHFVEVVWVELQGTHLFSVCKMMSVVLEIAITSIVMRSDPVLLLFLSLSIVSRLSLTAIKAIPILATLGKSSIIRIINVVTIVVSARVVGNRLVKLVAIVIIVIVFVLIVVILVVVRIVVSHLAAICRLCIVGFLVRIGAWLVIRLLGRIIAWLVRLVRLVRCDRLVRVDWLIRLHRSRSRLRTVTR